MTTQALRKYDAVNFTDVVITGAFWRERLDTVLKHTIPSQYEKLVEFDMIKSLEVRQPPPPLTIPKNNHNFTTQIFWDSDIGKWIEAASYALHHGPDKKIEQRIDEITDLLAKAQRPDGYLNCWYIGREIDKRWTNLRDNHELYNAGHLLEGAIAYFQATGKRKLLDVMERYIDHIASTFGPGDIQKHGYPGHQEIEIALMKLYRLTGDKRRLDLCTYFINERGKQPYYYDTEAVARGDDPKKYWHKTYEYAQAHKPVREQTKVVGHAVRAFYMYTAMADLAAELGDSALKKACETLWRDAVQTKMYVTAGFGPSAFNEGFTTDYDLPNDTAYAETCATVAMIFWAQRMLNLDLDGQYADVLELGLFNGGLSGLSRDGTTYFYENKLESDGSHTRWAWHNCPCCTMNVSRLVASIGGYFYSVGDRTIAVHLYGGAQANIKLGATSVKLTETSNYPWDGKIKVNIDPDAETKFVLKLRIPAWSHGKTKAKVNGKAFNTKTNMAKGYLVIDRKWNAGDVVTLDIAMPARRIYANPAVKADVGKVALARGPLVYCVEQVDNAKTPVSNLFLPQKAKVAVEKKQKLLGGTVVLKASARTLSRKQWEGSLYLDLPPVDLPATLTAIPYYQWANRGKNAMRVWINEKQ
jgi:DUF1680 family protein